VFGKVAYYTTCNLISSFQFVSSVSCVHPFGVEPDVFYKLKEKTVIY